MTRSTSKAGVSNAPVFLLNTPIKGISDSSDSVTIIIDFNHNSIVLGRDDDFGIQVVSFDSHPWYPSWTRLFVLLDETILDFI